MAYARGFLRVRVMINTSNPILAGCWLARQGDWDSWVEFCYERLQNFCYKCERIGHVSSECSIQSNNNSYAEYGEWTRTKMVCDMHENTRSEVVA